MLKKIISIKNVGKFINYNADGDVTFRNITLIWSENALGKTTLSAIFRSLKSNEVKYILERQTLGSEEPPEINIRLENENARFTNGTWNVGVPEFEIFDTSFVIENVYSGDTVVHEHSKNLHKFVIGEGGVHYAKKISDLDDEIRTINTKINEHENNIRQHIIGFIAVNEFCRLEKIDNIDAKISEKEEEILALKKIDEIIKKPIPTELSLPTLPFLDITELLAKEFKNISEEAEAIVKKHVEECMDNRGENWVEQGIKYIKNEKCPFCVQNIKGNDLVLMYKAYFTTVYEDFKEEIRNIESFVMQEVSQDYVLRLQRDIDFNTSLAEYWKTHVGESFPIILFDEINKVLLNITTSITSNLKRKYASPLERIEIDDKLKKDIDSFNGILAKVAKYNEKIGLARDSINKKKRELGEKRLEDAERELQILKNKKNRHSDVVSKLCEEYNIILNQKAEKEQEKEDVKKKLHNYSNNLLKSYQDKINEHLANFGADFKILETSEKFFGGKPSVKYRLMIRDIPFDLEEQDINQPNPCFKNTLSAGDKNTLAFAFFLARLEIEPDLKNKIVVFDDPISSHDVFRKVCTQQCINRLCSAVKQVIVLSHEPFFLKRIYDHTDKSTTKTLYIHRTSSSSVISEWNIEKATQNEYFQNFFMLVSYIDNGSTGSLRPIAQSIRPLLECNLRHRFPGAFESNEWLGDFIRKIEKSNDEDNIGILKPSLSELKELNQYSKEFHHDQNPNADRHPINDTELKSFARRTVNFIYAN